MICKNVARCECVGYCPRREPHKEQYGCAEESLHSREHVIGCVVGSTCVEHKQEEQKK